MQRHAPLKPIYICTACAHPWPCGPTKLELVRDYQDARRDLAVDLAALLREAIEDLTRVCPDPPDTAVLYCRFLGWLRSVRDV